MRNRGIKQPILLYSLLAVRVWRYKKYPVDRMILVRMEFVLVIFG